MRAVLAKLLLVSVCSLSAYAQTSGGTLCTTSGKTRLVGLGVTGAGRVELCLNGEWGSVCSSGRQWPLKNAQVVCRSLGFTTAVTAIPQESLVARLQATPSTKIHISDVVCDGREAGLLNCTYSTDTDQCSHFSDTAVVCAAVDVPGNITPGDVRLLGDTADFRGAVEYFDVILGWTGVCADSTHFESWVSGRAAQIVCTQLGFEGGTAFTQSAPFLEKLSVADLECSESALSLEDCDREPVVFAGGCASQDAGWVNCQLTEQEDFSVRLVPGGREGIVEVAINGRWGTVCEDLLWQQPNAQVLCDQLGLDSEAAPSITPQNQYEEYMSRLKPFWLSSVTCAVGIDQSLEECDHNLLIGYSADCSFSSSPSVYDSAEINCGPPVPFRLSGGAIAGIVLSVIAVFVAVTLGFIYLPERWKRRHQYSWYRKLTTPSRWCNELGSCCRGAGSWCQSHTPRPRIHVQRHRQQQQTSVSVATTSTDENPPATNSSPIREEPTSTTIVNGEPLAAESLEPVGGQSSEPTLTFKAPPPYQAAVAYPVATDLPQPPAYSKDPSLLEGSALPYPVSTTHDPAYPPPLPTQAGSDLPYPS